MKVLVTGAAGFIGSHIVDGLCGQGAKVICIDSLDPGIYHAPPAYLRSDTEYCFVDLRFWEPDSRFGEVEVIIHLAALGGVSRAGREPANIIDANCRGTARLAEVARRMPRLRQFILASSFSVYGANYTYRCASCGSMRNGDRREEDLQQGRYEVYCHRCENQTMILPITEAASPAPLETYGASKYMQELCLRGFSHCPVHIFRFSSAYGRRLRLDDGEATIIARLAGWTRDGERPRLFEDGQQIRDWVYVGDIVAAVLRVTEGIPCPPIVNVCSGVPIRLTEACSHISLALGVHCTPDIVGGFRPGDMRHCLGDPSTFSNLLGRKPVPFDEGATLAFSGIA